MRFSEEVKKSIAAKLATYCERYDSQTKAANTLKGVSTATISQMLNGKWKLITEQMWRNVAGQVGWMENEWMTADTSNMTELTGFYKAAQEKNMVLAITSDAGSGKTWTARQFCSGTRNAYLLCCNEFWNKKTFLTELCTILGIDCRGYNMGEMMQDIVWELKTRENPVVILDEADKLSDPILYFFITIYNYLEGECGLVLQATDYLEKRLKKGYSKNAKGFPEIWSRLGRRCIRLNGVNADDIRNICLANGLDDERDIELVVLDSESDFRRVKRKIQAIKGKRQAG